MKHLDFFNTRACSTIAFVSSKSMLFTCRRSINFESCC